ncbi:DNA polymerase III subunit delta' [Methylovorus menthalis]|uniref:DNA polymerase III subunit delta' n=1 Tax=Methylovorus menthalis TaxID=1002227 RepID=UPI001E5EC97A|nr:DNA polymerase III subunit delta' [Methylovorus menthalis]MCB4811754.1 DNA polymerase III subunit delta' [Methylovorus menthalis]
MSQESTIFPWQQAVWAGLIAQKKTLPHAMLLRGPAGIGKLQFAQALSKALLCQQPQADGHACGVCASCGWFAQGSHPDFRLLAPEQDQADEDSSAPAKTTSKKTQISVAQVRELGGFLELSSHHNDGVRIALICPAEGLNIASANALLKMLEEPPPGVVFLLVAHQPQRLLPTITSRCRKVDMPVPDMQGALAWLGGQGVEQAVVRLAYAGGSPMVARDQAEGSKPLELILNQLARGAGADAYSLVTMLNALGMAEAMRVLQKWLYDLLACRFAVQARYHILHNAALQGLAKSVDLAQMLELQRKLDDAYRSATHPLNNELQLESLMLQYVQLFSVKTRT